MTVEDLISRIEAHEKEGSKISEDTAALGMDKAAVKKLRRAKEEAERAKLTYDALVAGGMVPAVDEKKADEE